MAKQHLTFEDQKALVLETALQFVPVVGGGASTYLFGRRLEKRLSRLESFICSVRAEVQKSGNPIPIKSDVEAEKLEAIVENLSEKVEREQRTERLNDFKRLLVNTIKTDSINFDKTNCFLQALGDLSVTDVVLLIFIRQNPSTIVGAIKTASMSQYEVLASVNALRHRGFLKVASGNVSIGSSVDNSLSELVTVSSFGEEFIKFCL